MSKFEFDYLVFIGRFQPLHNGHIGVIAEALSKARKVIILVGSSFQPRNVKNPFTFDERATMIKSSFADCKDRLIVCPILDYPYNDDKWVAQVQSVVKTAALNNYPDNSEHVYLYGLNDMKIGLIGFNKDHSSFYLKMFPEWKSVDVEPITTLAGPVSATEIRYRLFTFNSVSDDYVSTSTKLFIKSFQETTDFKQLVDEYDFVKKYKESWSSAPYAPTFVTVDAVVVQSGHVLVVRRGANPGKGQLALPGGFIDQNETIFSACLRELREETRLKVPEPVIAGSLVKKEVFDHPDRSLRGRTITHAFYFRLNDRTYLPDVRGGDDAERAFWLPLSMLESNRVNFYEDHLHIIQTMVGT